MGVGEGIPFGNQRRKLGILLLHSPPYSLQLEPRTELEPDWLPASPSHGSCLPSAQCWGFRYVWLWPAYHLGSGDSNSDPYACAASTITTKPSPQPHHSYFNEQLSCWRTRLPKVAVHHLWTALRAQYNMEDFLCSGTPSLPCLDSVSRPRCLALFGSCP